MCQIKSTNVSKRYSQWMHTIVELADFTRLWPRYWSEKGYNEFISYIAQILLLILDSTMTTKRSLPLSDEELEEFEAKRDLYAELKQAAKDIEAGLGRVVYSPIIAARKNTGLSQAEFAEHLGVTASTLEDWEQRRAIPDAASLALITSAREDPPAFRARMSAREEESVQK